MAFMHSLLLIVSSSSSQFSCTEGIDVKGSSTDINLCCSGLMFGKYFHSLNLLWNQGLNIRASNPGRRKLEKCLL